MALGGHHMPFLSNRDKYQHLTTMGANPFKSKDTNPLQPATFDDALSI